MYITMYCGGMPFDGETIKNQSLGGSESAAYYMAIELAKQNHKVTLFTSIDKDSETNGVRYLPIGKITEETPLGEYFHHYAMNTPTDVMIIQRHPKAFLYKWASKLNLWWLHDLATKRLEKEANVHMYNIDAVLCVSEWHKQQVVDTWGLDPNFVSVIRNGVDLELYDGEVFYTTTYGDQKIFGKSEPGDQIKLIYSSRPERGLENLVKPKGIMAKIYETNPEYHLYVCNYDNHVQQMEGYYNWLYEQCERLPNVTMLGHLTKRELADVQRQCDLCIYPTAFEETSCITVMECAAAKLTLLTSDAGALKETSSDTDAHLIELMEKEEDYRGMELRVAGMVDVGAFVAKLRDVGYKRYLENYRYHQEFDAEQFRWSLSAADLLSLTDDLFDINSASSEMRNYINTSDIYALKNYIGPSETIFKGSIEKQSLNELKTCYDFINDKWKDHYEKYYEYEKARGVVYGPENLDNQPRFELVSDYISTLSAGSVVLDYGCAHGHFTVNLAKRFPQIGFVGVDIASSNIKIARKWASDENLSNAKFLTGEVKDDVLQVYEKGGSAPGYATLDLIIAAEVLEHVERPTNYIDTLSKYLKDGGQFYITTPYGPWEAEGYEEHWPWRAHVHHFEREDISDMFGMHKGFNVVVAPAGYNKFGDPMGSYIYMFEKPKMLSGKIDYNRKHNTQSPRQTLSLCMIVKDAELDIGRCLKSVVGVVDEIIIGLDETTTDSTYKIIDNYKDHTPITVLNLETPTKTGFEVARNKTIEKASGDWILWIDSDEVLHNPQNIHKYLRNNHFNGYAIAQHHFSQEPMGVMKTDYPIRLFRNNKGIKFFGVVHEHPETGINEGVGKAINLIDVEIAHYGYSTENIRRKRFERNIGLMIRDREMYPERKLGKFLWLRDLSQMCGFELQSNGMNVTNEMLQTAREGASIFEELLKPDSIKMAIDGLDFYSRLSGLVGGVEFNAELDGQNIGGIFKDPEHFKKLVNLIVQDKIKNFEHTKYM